MSDSLPPHGLQPTRLLSPWDFPGKSAGVGCHCLLQGLFPTQGSNRGLPHCRQTLYRLSSDVLMAAKQGTDRPARPQFKLRALLLCVASAASINQPANQQPLFFLLPLPFSSAGASAAVPIDGTTRSLKPRGKCSGGPSGILQAVFGLALTCLGKTTLPSHPTRVPNLHQYSLLFRNPNRSA